MPQFTVNKSSTKTVFSQQSILKGLIKWQNSYQLNLFVSKLSKRKCYLSFSCGKDSIASFLYMRECECWDEIIPVFYYYHPELEFEQESLAYYEKIFQTKILRFPSPNILSTLSWGWFQTPYSFLKIQQYRDYINGMDFDDSDIIIREEYGHAGWYFATGVRMADGIQRRGSIIQNGGLRQTNNVNKFFPVFDFTDREVYELIKHYGIKLPCDYTIWGRTFDGTQYRFTKDMEKELPGDYARLKKLFPLLDVLKFRYSIINNNNLILK